MFIARLIAQRFLLALFTLLLVSFLIFAVLEILPGDVATRILGRDATPETLAALRERMHLDDPALLRYGRWLWGVLQGDFGQSLVSSRSVMEVLGPRIVNTAFLSVYAFILYVPLATLPAILQAIRRDRPVDHALSVDDARAPVHPGFPARHAAASHLRPAHPRAAGHVDGRPDIGLPGISARHHASRP